MNLARNNLLSRSPMPSYVSSGSTHNSNVVACGWLGLKYELLRFFMAVKPYVVEVFQKQHKNIAAARNKNLVHMFSNTSGQWTVKSEKDTSNSTVPPLENNGMSGTRCQ